LLVNFVETYLTLSEDEQAVYKGRLGQGGHMAVQALEMTWGERLRQEGREEGREEGVQVGALAAKREMLLDVLRIRFSEVPEALAAIIAQACAGLV
jgi:predicted transposase YdaD